MTVAMPAACSLLLLLLLVAPVAAGNPKRHPIHKPASKCVIKGVRWANWEQLMEEQAPVLVIDDHHHQPGSPAHTYGAFIFDLSVGRQALSVVMDISSELVWARCGPRLRPTRPRPPSCPTTSAPSPRSPPAHHGCATTPAPLARSTMLTGLATPATTAAQPAAGT
uniref:Peptidase A1 domain-containing protein n=1 Tax=Aegilops tauschii subsp. strangulata TaxID=200361 RepID=A0A453SZH7_AEGTS